MKEHKVEQGTYEWHLLRLNRLTSTRVAHVFKSDNLGLVDELIAERINPVVEEEGYVSEAMQRGTDLEPVAIEAYTAQTGIVMESVGFCTHDVYDWLGMSPDGLTPDRTGATEVKCPDTKTHVQYIRMGGIPNKHKYQIAQYFIVNKKLEWLDFVSFDPRFTVKPMYIYRVHRADVDVAGIFEGVVKFYAKFEKYFQQVTF